LIERQPAAQTLGLAWSAIGEFRIGMQTGHRWVGPRVVAWFPRCNDPAHPVIRTTRDVGIGDDFVRIRLRSEARGAFEHHTILHTQIAQDFARAILEPYFHAHRAGGGPDSRSKHDAV